MTLRSQAVAAGAIVALGVGAAALVLVVTRPSQGPRSGDATPAAEVSAPSSTGAPGPAAPRETARASGPAPTFAPPLAPSPVADSTEPRTVQLPPRALASLAAPVAPCLRGGGLGGTSPTVLALRLRTVAGGAEVIDADVASSGEAEPSLVACARDAVRGTRLEVPGFAPGELLATTWEVGAGYASTGALPASAVAPAAPRPPRVFRRQRGK